MRVLETLHENTDPLKNHHTINYSLFKARLKFLKNEMAEKDNVVNQTSNSTEDQETSIASVEVIRRCSKENIADTSWDPSYCYVSVEDSKEVNSTGTIPFISVMVVDDSTPSQNSHNTSTQTDPCELGINCGISDVSLSFTTVFNTPEITTNENSEKIFRSKRIRHDSHEGEKVFRPWKKLKYTKSCNSGLTADTKSLAASVSSSQLSSASDISFKSINSKYSNQSFKVRKRRLKSDTNLFRDALQKSRKNMNSNKSNYSENNTPGGSPRKERNHRRNAKTKGWKFVDLCTWIGMKSYQSITGMLREPPQLKQESNLREEVRELRRHMEEVDGRQARLAWENEALQEQMKEMSAKILELESRLRSEQEMRSRSPSIPPPPPPPPPPPLNPPITGPKFGRSNTIPRCGSAPPRMAGPRLTITPEDIANVKLRKAKDNPIPRSKSTQKTLQPLVTQQMLQTTRAKLGRTRRPVAASTPKQQIAELEKCLLQDTWVSTLYRKRITRGTFRSVEDLRTRPYPTARCSKSPRSPRSPRSNSLPRSPLKCPLTLPK